MKKIISVVVPMYNEEKVIPIFFDHLNKVLQTLPTYQFEVVVVNDGSKDKTLELLLAQQSRQANLVVVNLTRNFGHEPAVAAGIKTAKGDAIIPMDADLQDPPELIKEMLLKFESGYEVVNAKRASRKEDSFLKRFTAKKFYEFIAKLSGKVKIPNNVGHFRLVSRRVANDVIALSEKNRVFRVQVPFAGYKTTEVLFNRPKRAAGQTHYNYKSMFRLAFDAIIATTHAPLMWPLIFTVYFSVILGLSIAGELVIALLQWTQWLPLSFDATLYWVWGLSNALGLVFAFLFFFLSIVALYLSKIFVETQNRPFFLIENVYRKEA